MKLKSGCTFWPQVYPGEEQRFPPLDHDITCDVAIIGGGISGALAAYHLIAHGLHVVMLDRRRVGHSSTSASTGLLQYEIDTPLVELINKLGKDRAIAAYRASVESLLAFGPLVAELGDSCGLVPRPSLYLASSEKDVAELRDEYAARRAMDIDVEFIEPDKLREDFHIARSAALWSQRAFEVDPFRLTLKLIARAIEKGLEFFEETKISQLIPRTDGLTLHTSKGPRIHARKVIFTTGYETFQRIPPGLCRLSSTYAFVSEPLPSFDGWRDRCLIWESARPYLYMRTTEDNRVIVGGADEQIVDPRRRDELLSQKTEHLRERFGQLFPELPLTNSCAWTGTFAQTRDGLPYIGTLARYPHGYFALGYGGNGITFSLLAAQILTDLFLGRPNQNATLFGFYR